MFRYLANVPGYGFRGGEIIAAPSVAEALDKVRASVADALGVTLTDDRVRIFHVADRAYRNPLDASDDGGSVMSDAEAKHDAATGGGGFAL